MCNLYSVTKGQQAIRELARTMSDRTGNLPLLPAYIRIIARLLSAISRKGVS